MTAQPSQNEFDVSPRILFAQARSDWLDSFSRLEVAVLRCEERFLSSPTPRGMPLSQRLTDLASLSPNSTLSKATLKKLQELVRECEMLLPLRATIVHSAMRLGRRDESDVALFQNAVDAARDIPTYVIMAEEDFARRRKAVQSLTDQFRSLAKAS